MPAGVVSGVGRGMGALAEAGDRPRGRGNFGMNLGSPIVTSGDFVALVILCREEWFFSNYFGIYCFLL